MVSSVRQLVTSTSDLRTLYLKLNCEMISLPELFIRRSERIKGQKGDKGEERECWDERGGSYERGISTTILVLNSLHIRYQEDVIFVDLPNDTYVVLRIRGRVWRTSSTHPYTRSITVKLISGVY